MSEQAVERTWCRAWRRVADALIKQDLKRMLPGTFGQHGTTIAITAAGREALAQIANSE